MSILIRNIAAMMGGTDGQRPVGSDLRIEGAVITAIGNLQPQPDETCIDATDCIAYPAWVNTHHHLFQSLLKGEPEGLNATLTPWLASTPYRFRGAFDEQSFRIAVRVGLAELALSGCGTVADHHYLAYPGQSYDASGIIFEEAEAMGLRTVLCRGGATLTRQLEAELPTALRPENFDDYLKDVERLVKQHHDPLPGSMKRVVMAPTTPTFSMTSEQMKLCASLARQWGIRLHSHLSETVSYQDACADKFGTTPVRFAQTIDWLGPDVWFAHLVHLQEDEVRMLGETRTGIAHCPQSNGRLGSGIAPLQALAKAGANISIAVDGAASNEAADMISEVHAAWLMSRARSGSMSRAITHGGEGEKSVEMLTVDQLVRWSTHGGAQVLGFPKLGELAIGQLADIALYDLTKDPRYFGVHDLACAPVICGGRAHLKRLWVGGQEVVRDGQLPSIDLRKLQHDAAAQVVRLQGRSLKLFHRAGV